MDRRENKAQAPGICQRLFNLVIDSLLFRGLKRVTLGRPKPVEERGMHNLAYGMPRTTESLVERASKLNNSFPIMSIGSAVNVQRKGVVESREEFFEVQSPLLRPIPVRGSQNQVTEQDDNQTRFEQERLRRGKEVVSPSDTGSLTRRPKKVVINDGEKKGKSGVWMKEKLAEVTEPDKDVKVRSTTPMIPIISSAFNIDERSDELIRRTREALRNSARQS